jgi:hypothetical protein
MTESLRIETGEIRLLINGDPQRVLRFNPDDVVFVEKFYDLMQAFAKREKDFIKRAEALDAETEVDEFGIPVNTKERLAFVREISEWLREQIDDVFGEGTAQTVFGDTHAIEAYNQFFDGIAPYIQKTRSEKMRRYSKVVRERKEIEDEKRVME